MILIEFLLAPTVPSEPRPQKTAPHDFVRLDVEVGIEVEAGVGHVVDDADGEVILGSGLLSSSKTPLTIAGVNSLDDRP